MESENPSVNSTSANPNVSKAMVETLVPAGLTGVVREKAIDAMFLSISVLHMSLEDVQRRIQEIAMVHHQPLDSPQVWLKFNREVQALSLTRDPVKDLADQLPPKERSEFLASVSTAKKVLGYSPEDVKELLSVVQMGNVNDPAGAAKAFSEGISGEVGDHANSVSGRNGVYSWDQKATGWGGDGQDGTGTVVKPERDIADAATPAKTHGEMIVSGGDDDRDSDREAILDHIEVDVEAIHRKATYYLNDRNYIGYRTFMENAEILDRDHKGRGKAAKNRDDQEPDRITAKIRTNLWLKSDDSARGAIPDIMKKIRELQGLPEPEVMTQKALERMETPLDKLVADLGEKKGKRRDNKPALER
ncbi:hypothetical protein NR402_10910 [Acidithiobacillus ferrooxidans]|uniref:hypothetical protein n=1 Tax=Acidithiobacillus ferrooxidans TaxID=920 RepID=UPI00214B507C|nr:hypothetical protein [Acidithiobacillus ferrooxidans]MCR2830785.1 hypothetical protein [Acidithiobacillus ferrooxidans]